MSTASPVELDGKRAYIEVREGRRWHRMVVADLKKEEDGLYAIFREAYPKHYPEPSKIKIPEKLLSLFEPVCHADYDFRLRSVLLKRDPQSDDECGWVRPPIIVTQADIDAAKNENSA
jgi:hypothetical protein